MKFLVDAQLPPALAHWLRETGHEATHVADIGLREAEDGVKSWVTKDEDFAARSARAATAPVIVWLRVGNTTNRALRAWIEPRLPGIVRLIAQGHRLIEVL